MKHLGDITKLKGSEVPLVDIVTGGSPCQDLSVAGKREGLAGERSGLFMEQIRLIKEMRESDRADGRTDEYIRPRYMVWENVPGAFSSNKGEDFRCVLEETAKVADSNAIIPRLATGKDGKQKWSKSGCIMGDGWSIAWRVHDAQWWGVPQRRKRICLLADFNGDSAGRILFELRRKTADGETVKTISNPRAERRQEVLPQSKGLSGDITESGEKGQGAATDVKRGIDPTGGAISFQERAGKPGGGKGILIQNERTGALSTLNNQSVCAFEPGAASRLGGYCWEDKAGTLRANAGDNQQAVVYGIGSYDSNAMKSDNPHSGIYEADTSRTLDLNGGNPGCNQGGMAVVQGADVYNGALTGEVAATLTNACGGSNTSGAKVVCIEGNGSRPSHKGDGYAESETMYTLNGTEHHAVAVENHPVDSRVPMVMEQGFAMQAIGEYKQSRAASSLKMRDYKDATDLVVASFYPQMKAESQCYREDDISNTLVNGTNPGFQNGVCYGLDRAAYNQGQNAKFGFSVDEEKVGAQTAKGPGAVCSAVDCRNGVKDENVNGSLQSRASNNTNSNNVCRVGSVVRRLTPLECERLQGFPTIRKVRFTEMTKDEYIAWNINEGHIVVDTEYGKVFATRGQGGIKLDEPKELMGSVVNGYRVVSIRNGNTKMQCRVHRIVWIAEHGVIPDGYVIDHINNDKQDNRLCNLQLLTPKENSTKARADGLYKIHGEAGQSKITDEVHDFIQYVYGNTDLSIRQLSEIFGISKSRVHQIIHDEAWTDIGEWVDSKGKKHKNADSPRYKALGNSIALPFWQWLAERICSQYEGVVTMASLFDGIGGFPLVFSWAGCTPVWASEIEEFPIAVTKIRFKEEVET